MSHFAVLVIGDNAEEQLQPYHEYECTGITDEYVFDVDKTEVVNEWLNREVFVGINEDGKMDYQYTQENADKFLTHVEKMTKKEFFEKNGDDIDREIIGYFGVEKKNGIWTCYTNPNAKWDWYVLGGRYTGYFKAKEGTVGIVGSLGLMTAPASNGYVDSALKRDIDFEGMRNEAVESATKRYDKAMQIIGHLPVNQTWEEICKDETLTRDELKNKFWAQERCKAWKESNDASEFGFFSSPDDFILSKEEYVQQAKNNAIVAFAFVKDSKWYAKGRMGWWCMVLDEKDSQEWAEEFNKMIDDLPEDTLLSVYDCHI